MKVKNCKRYKCDFCGRVGYQRAGMERHERGCTNNPDRICRMHSHISRDSVAPKVSDMIFVLRAQGLPALDNVADGCPACILAALRQSGLNKGTVDEEGYTPPAIQWDFKKAMKEFWDQVNADADEARSYHG